MAEHKSFITTTQGMSGFFAVHVWWNPEGFWEPWDTGIGRYSTEERAIEEAQSWAENADLEYVPRPKPTPEQVKLHAERAAHYAAIGKRAY